MPSDSHQRSTLEKLLPLDDAARRREFSWTKVRKTLMGLPDGGLNIAVEAVDRHVAEGRGQREALRWLARDGRVVSYCYDELKALSDRFANLLQGLGVGQGQRVFSLLGRVPELHIAALGTLKHGAVFCPLFSAFGPDPIATRLRLGEGRVLITTAALYQRKIAHLRATLPDLHHVLLIDDEGNGMDTLGFQSALDTAPITAPAINTRAEDRALLHFTSGTTGTPKAAVHVHEAVVAHLASARLALDLQPSDVFWCTADPGWVTGISYGFIAPLVVGAVNLLDEGEFQVRRWYQILQNQGVTVWYTAPTAVRMLMKAGESVAREYDLHNLRFLASVGEPLNAEAVLWGEKTLGKPFHDTWWQSETGAIMIANLPGLPVRPGAMGRPLPGIDATVLKRTAAGERVLCDADEEGELALVPNWPSRFRGYLGDPERYQAVMGDDYYFTGDLVRRDVDGYFWFVGRADDVIKSAGHLIGPFEVESALMRHPAVAEAGVIGKPDDTVMEIVKAFVSLRDGHQASEALRRELLGFARQHLGPTVAPRELEFMEDLPKTRSGKILRRVLKARELHLPEGDLSILEESREKRN